MMSNYGKGALPTRYASHLRPGAWLTHARCGGEALEQRAVFLLPHLNGEVSEKRGIGLSLPAAYRQATERGKYPRIGLPYSLS